MASPSLDIHAWLDAALVALLEGGTQAVAVEPLARRLGVTKGSFYWHFTNRDALFEGLVERWAKQTESLIEEVSAMADPRERLTYLLEAAHRSRTTMRTMRAMSSLATVPKIGVRVKAVARRRQDFIATCFRGLGCSRVQAAAAARLVHAAYLGTGVLDALDVGATTDSERKAYLDEFLAIVERAPPRAAGRRPASGRAQRPGG